ncbi:conserved hypothetical protein [Microbacterium sp. 8M]|uniref:hypothetical protein n=1 Tax=Microbacterium sp. 8M TaxID=2653153 RepID=UPI0012F0A598|nr:hypothetical protein [Microbacterium sp. 8M]VXC29186.1 conserved hypothetical protein [Microbacterium sp. 8M]
MTERARRIAVAGAHRTIRVLSDGEGPFPGELVSRGDAVAVRVPTAALRGWAGWMFAGCEHVAAPLDLALGMDGHDVLLPWCVRTVGAHLAGGGDAGMTRGEVVTLAVSMLRGVRELDPEGVAPEAPRADDQAEREELRGRWWLTDEGRPVFAVPASSTGDDTACASAQQLLRELESRAEDRALRRLLLRLADALDDPRRLRAEAARWEDELLEVAAPRPLRLREDEDGDPAVAIDRPVPSRREQALRRRDLRAVAAAGGRRGRQMKGGAARTGSTSPWRPTVLRQAATAAREAVLARLGRLAGRSSSLRSGQTPAHGGRRRWAGPAAVALAAATVIAVGGALWPTGAGSVDAVGRAAKARPSATPSTAGATTASAGTAAPLHAPTPVSPGPTATAAARDPGPSAQQDPARAGEELIAAALRCRAAAVPACGELWDGGRAAAKELRDGDATAVLIEDYGDVAALRSGSGSQAQMVVIIRRDAEWRIRDVYDIADPPSEGAGAP